MSQEFEKTVPSSRATDTGSIAPASGQLPSFHTHPEFEKHTRNTGFVRDAIIGLADGLTVPFALTAGLSSIGSTKLVILGGLAELFAGSISMGLGAYLAGITEKRHYEVEKARERRQIVQHPEQEMEIMSSIFAEYDIGRKELQPMVDKLKNDPDSWVKFMMHFELNLEERGTSAPWLSALVMGLAYLFGGLIPMIPYFAVQNVNNALFVSIGITAVMLMIFGYVKAIVTGTNRRTAVYGAFETLLIGAVAAGASYGIVKGVDSRFELHE